MEKQCLLSLCFFLQNLYIYSEWFTVFEVVCIMQLFPSCRILHLYKKIPSSWKWEISNSILFKIFWRTNCFFFLYNKSQWNPKQHLIPLPFYTPKHWDICENLLYLFTPMSHKKCDDRSSIFWDELYHWGVNNHGWFYIQIIRHVWNGWSSLEHCISICIKPINHQWKCYFPINHHHNHSCRSPSPIA